MIVEEIVEMLEFTEIRFNCFLGNPKSLVNTRSNKNNYKMPLMNRAEKKQSLIREISKVRKKYYLLNLLTN
jgi:hypothetical protein